MKKFLQELKRRNEKLFYFGLLNFIAAIVCIGLTLVDHRQILGINAWMKPMKFFFSIWIMSWTMGWLLHYLQYRRAVAAYSWMLIISMIIETSIISTQSARGLRSHFNVSTGLDAILFMVMGIVISLFTIWTGYICYLFFRQKKFTISVVFLWGIRIGMILFIISAIEGGLMVHYLRHTIGGPDGSRGLPIVNWSRIYGDLRVAHFFGLHALQIIPLLSYYVVSSKKELIFFSIIYTLMVAAFLMMAFRAVPLV
jgi:hypothetical protein